MRRVFGTNRESGSILNIALLVIMLLSVVAIGVARNMTTDIRIADNVLRTRRAFYAAETGWQVAVTWLDSVMPLPVDNHGLENSGGNISFAKNKYNTADILPMPDSNYNYSVNVTYAGVEKAHGYSDEQFKRISYSIVSAGTGARHADVDITVNGGKVAYTGEGY